MSGRPRGRVADGARLHVRDGRPARLRGLERLSRLGRAGRAGRRQGGRRVGGDAAVVDGSGGHVREVVRRRHRARRRGGPAARAQGDCEPGAGLRHVPLPVHEPGFATRTRSPRPPSTTRSPRRPARRPTTRATTATRSTTRCARAAQAATTRARRPTACGAARQQPRRFGRDERRLVARRAGVAAERQHRLHVGASARDVRRHRDELRLGRGRRPTDTLGSDVWTISPPLAGAARFAGVPTVDLDVSSPADGANLSVDVYDIDAKSSALLLSRTAYLLPQGESRIAQEMYGNDRLIPAGHRRRPRAPARFLPGPRRRSAGRRHASASARARYRHHHRRRSALTLF